MKPVQRILIITGSAGGGHVSAANALEEEASALGLECKTIDALNASKFFRFSTQGVYEVMVRLCPWMWGAFYNFLERNNVALNMHTRFTTTHLGQLDSIIQDYKPNWIICAHDVALPRIALLRRYPHDFQLAVTVTDVHPHVLWIEGTAQADAEVIFVSCYESKENILSRSNISADRIIVSGIPIGSAFARPRLSEIGTLPSTLPTILVTSGMIGAGRYLDVLKALAKVTVKSKLVFVCGRNEVIRKKLRKLADALMHNTPHEYDIRGCVDRDEMAWLLHHSTMLVGKPGGLTMSEALAAGCPFVIYKPFQIPGQEQKNADFLMDHGIAVRAKNPPELSITVQRLLTNSEELSRMRKNALASGKPNAARQVLQTMMQNNTDPLPTPDALKALGHAASEPIGRAPAEAVSQRGGIV